MRGHTVTNTGSQPNSAGDERIWDQFLTPQDRELAATHVRKPYGMGANPALLLIDLYRKVYGDRPQPIMDVVGTEPSNCGLAGWEALPHTERLLATARTFGLPVIHVTGSADIPAWRAPRGGTPLSPDELERAYELMPSVAPQPGEVVIRKAAPSSFFGTPLSPLLRQLGVDSLIVAGESTSGCVRATVVDARSHRFSVTVVEDCVFDRTLATHAINLFDMDQKYADVRSIDDVVTELTDRAGATA